MCRPSLVLLPVDCWDGLPYDPNLSKCQLTENGWKHGFTHDGPHTHSHTHHDGSTCGLIGAHETAKAQV